MDFRKKLYRFTIVLTAIILTAGCTLPKAFEALEVYNYFQAKNHFEKAIKKDPVVAKYGLSIIQQRTDNPFFNIDTAYQNITYAVVHYDSLNVKKKEKYADLGITKASISAQQKLIAKDMFKRAVSENSELAFQKFIEKNFTSELVPEAVFLRDSLFFEAVVAKNTAESYQSFIDKYPTSFYYQQAFQRFERQLYAEQTEKDDLSSYTQFLVNYPDNPFAIDAENQIYKIITDAKTAASYERFINEYPKNRNVRDAWGKLYDAFLTENFSNSAIADFIKKYPNNPFKNDVEGDLALSKTIFYQVQKDGKWGFKSESGKYEIKGDYDYVDAFYEGLALVVRNDKIGYMTKKGDLKIDCQFDDGLPFSEGTAVVEVSGKYGLINRRGNFIIPAEFDYLGELNNGLIPFEQDEKYGYFDSKGNVKIEPQYDNAYNFENDMAQFGINDKWGIVNTEGAFVFEPEYEALDKLNDTVYALYDGDFWGALDLKKDTVMAFKYDYIGAASNNYYLVTKNDSFNYISTAGDLLLANNWQPIYPEYKILAKYDNTPILVWVADGYNYMRTNGEFVFKKPKNKLGTYSSQIAFEKEGKWGYLSPSPANEIIKPIYDEAYSFEYGFGIISLAPFYGTITADGNVAIDAYYEELSFLNAELLLAKGRGDYGILSTAGDTILSFSSRKIEPFAENIVKVSGGGSVSYYNYISNNWIRKEE